MKTLRKIRKNEKALSPVVASIILIAVTVAVSIAVAAWMGSLTTGFMETHTVTITNAAFSAAGDVNSVITLSVKNTGTSAVTISTAKINGDTYAITDSPVTIEDGATGSLVLTLTSGNYWVAGNSYKADLYDASGQLVGSYQATAT
jgi:flagellin-like protein